MTAAPRRRTWATRISIVAGGILALAIVAVAVVTVALPVPGPAGTIFQGCQKLWSHRTLAGGAPGIPENTVEGVRSAFALGAGGVEIDVVFEPSSDHLFAQSGEAADAGLSPDLPLDTLLRAVPSGGFVWLDFWTLDGLPEAAVQAAVARLKTVLDETGSMNRTFVESTDVERLRLVAQEGITTSLWIAPAPMQTGRRGHLVRVLRSARAFRRGPFSAVSMSYEDYSPVVRAIFWRVPILLFTINDTSVVRSLASDSRVRVILTDRVPFATGGCG